MTTFSPYCAGSVATRRSIGLSVDLRRDAAVLRDAPLGDVEVGEDLDARGDRRDRPSAGTIAASWSTPSMR